YVARNGKAFEDMIREREGANPKFTFLREKGEGCEYFRWRVYCLQMKFEKHEMDAMLREAFPPLGEEDLNTFKEMLTSLTGSKDHIRSMRAWIMSHEENVEFICEHFHARIISIKEFQPRLHIVYVLNDVLHACLKKRMDPSIIDVTSERIFRHVLRLLHPTFQDEPDAENRGKISKVLGLWRERNIFSPQEIEQAMSDRNAIIPSPTVDLDSLGSFQSAMSRKQPPAPNMPHPLQAAPPSLPPPLPVPPQHPSAQNFVIPPTQNFHPPIPPPQTIPPPLPPAQQSLPPPAQPPKAPIQIQLSSAPPAMPPQKQLPLHHGFSSSGDAIATCRPADRQAARPPTQGFSWKAPDEIPAGLSLLDSLDKFYSEPIVNRVLQMARESNIDPKNVQDVNKMQEEEVNPDGLSGVPATRAALSWSTPRKIVPKISNQIVGIKNLKKQTEEDDDVADVFKSM
ncbi:hypothetical protein GUITHDRAFT_149666, partial [Guillardia theta CCMP2712]